MSHERQCMTICNAMHCSTRERSGGYWCAQRGQEKCAGLLFKCDVMQHAFVDIRVDGIVTTYELNGAVADACF